MQGGRQVEAHRKTEIDRGKETETDPAKKIPQRKWRWRRGGVNKIKRTEDEERKSEIRNI